ncbi:MAG: hypothetical protein J6I69_02240 [Bacilli bacterium]|nr:hypothetical protein [Bacilli bacterium]
MDFFTDVFNITQVLWREDKENGRTCVITGYEIVEDKKNIREFTIGFLKTYASQLPANLHEGQRVLIVGKVLKGNKFMGTGLFTPYES